MMRIIKLIVLVAVVAGIIVGIMFIPSIIGSGGNGPGGGGSDFIRLTNDIEQRWEHSGATWSLDDYNKLRADIDVCRKKLTENDYRTLRQSNANAAVNVLHDSMMTAFEHNASETDIRKLKGDVDELKNDITNQLENNKKVEECEGTYKLYRAILEYGRTNFSFSPGLEVRGNSVTFTEFKVHESNVKARGEELKSRRYYGRQYYYRIKDRNDVKGAFDKVDAKLSAEKSAYPAKVAQAIKDEFNKREYTKENLDLLKEACKAFSKEFSEDDSLVEYRNMFESKVSN